MKNVRQFLDQLNRFSVIDASAFNKEVLLENDIRVTYQVKSNTRFKDMTFQAVIYVRLGKSEPISWGCIEEQENHEVVKWFELKESSIFKRKQAEIKRDTQILKSLIKL